MDDSMSDMQKTHFNDNYSSWLNNNFGMIGTGEEPASLFDIRYQYPVSDPGSPPEERAYKVQQGRQSEHDCRYWLPEYYSCCGGYWGDNMFTGGGYSLDDDDGCNDWPVKTEDTNQSEDQYRSHSSFCENEYSQPDCDYNPWSYRQYGEDGDSYSYDGDEPRTTYRKDEVGVFEGIFGYFPCLLRDNNMQ